MRLGSLLHSHPLHLPPVWQGQSQVELDIMLLGKDTCGVCDAGDLGHSLDHSLVCYAWSAIVLRELERCSWGVDSEIVSVVEVQGCCGGSYLPFYAAHWTYYH